MSSKSVRSRVWIAILFLIFIFEGLPPNRLAVKVIVGEAADQSFIGKVAVGEVIRRRKNLDGFSSRQKDLGLFYKSQPVKTRTAARIAWMLSAFTNFTGGADHFDNVKAFGVPKWAGSMKKTVKIDEMQYYRSRRRSL